MNTPPTPTAGLEWEEYIAGLSEPDRQTWHDQLSVRFNGFFGCDRILESLGLTSDQDVVAEAVGDGAELMVWSALPTAERGWVIVGQPVLQQLRPSSLDYVLVFTDDGEVVRGTLDLAVERDAEEVTS